MLVSYKWLQEYVEIPWAVSKLSNKLTDTGLEVKALEKNPHDKEDTIIEIEVTPNRPDCLSMIGVARELAAIQSKSLKYPDVTFPEDAESASSIASVTINAPDLCPRYAARIVRGVKIAPSPAWLANRLEAVGIRAINNVVDVTNYVLMEYGHPLHAFDLNRLDGKQIIVRRANPGETMITLDNQKRALDPERLVIADAKRPVALAGVMGGANSEVLTSTTDLLLESAYFNPVSIRKTSKKFGLRSEASYRFERGTDPENAILALNRATQLIAQLAGGKIAQGIIDAYPTKDPIRTITLRTHRVNEFLGINIRQKTITGILERIGCQMSSTSPEITQVQVPGYRRDLEREVDLIEEIARIYGFDKVPNHAPAISVKPNLPYKNLRQERKIKESLTHLGFWETLNYSLINSEEWAALGFNKDSFIPMRNPLSAEQDVLRSSLLPGLCKNISSNISLGQNVVRVFEIGRVMQKSSEPNKFQEDNYLAVAASGKSVGAVWEEKGLSLDIYGFKGIIEYLFQSLELNLPEMVSKDLSVFKPGVSAEIKSGEVILGNIGQVQPDLANNLGIEKDCFYFELNLDKIAELQQQVIRYKSLPKYPAITRDISLLVPSNTQSKDLQSAILDWGKQLVESANLFDLYSGDKIPTGHRSLSYRITYRHPERTLQESEVDTLHQNVVSQLTEKYNVKLRT